eukprot:TRINITY_DN2552_c0_g1_i1.p1 TRINITY_DN2552_c0_g1~~TRINITY_DN2552_c0_g1_i1.p1  ORF type:complete len:491 (-),score=70.34 TRINITY_DN2552_c0_g1_i1:557-1981(-)
MADQLSLGPLPGAKPKQTHLAPLDPSQGHYADFYNSHANAIQDSVGETKTIGEKKEMILQRWRLKQRIEKLVNQATRSLDIQSKPHATKQSAQTLRSVVDRMSTQQSLLQGALHELISLQATMRQPVDALVQPLYGSLQQLVSEVLHRMQNVLSSTQGQLQEEIALPRKKPRRDDDVNVDTPVTPMSVMDQAQQPVLLLSALASATNGHTPPPSGVRNSGVDEVVMNMMKRSLQHPATIPVSEPLRSRVMNSADIPLLLTLAARIYPCNHPASATTLMRWMSVIPQLAIIYEEQDGQIAGLALTIPLSVQGWGRLIRGEVSEGDIGPNELFRPDLDSTICLHVYHVEKITRSIPQFGVRVVQDIGTTIARTRQQINPSMRIGGFSALVCTRGGLSVFGHHLNMRESEMISVDHVMRRLDECRILTAPTLQTIAQLEEEGFTYAHRCQMLVTHPGDVSKAWHYLERPQSYLHIPV